MVGLPLPDRLRDSFRWKYIRERMAMEHLDPTPLSGMAHEPVRVAGCRWMLKTVTTDPPRYIPHTEYSWECELIGEVPLLAVLLLEDERGLHWVRSGRKSAATALVIRLAFLPYDWKSSSELQINLSQRAFHELSSLQVAVHDASLKRDPRGLVKFDLTEGGIAETGSLIRAATITSQEPISAGLVVVAQSDTESCRGSRWRIRRRIPVEPPCALSFLTTGRRSGFSPRHGMLSE